MYRKLNFITNLLLTAAFAAIFASCGKDEPENRAIKVQDDALLSSWGQVCGQPLFNGEANSQKWRQNK
jgi:hypothetical protein